MNVLRAYIREVLDGFGNKSLGKDGAVPNLRYDIGTKRSTNVLDDEDLEAQAAVQDSLGRQAACCLIVSGDGKILAVSRKDDPTMLGLPGGKVDPGETPEEAAARELWEECGIEALDMHEVFSCSDAQGYVTTTFACKADGEIHTDEPGVIRWVEPSVLLDPGSSPFTDYNKKLLNVTGMAPNAGQ